MAVRRELVERKLQLMAEDLGRIAPFRELTLDDLTADEIRLAALERMMERIVMRAIDVNEHLISELATGDQTPATRLTYRDTFLGLVQLGVYDQQFAERIAGSARLRNVLVHDYNDLDHRLLHGALQTGVADYYDYVQAVRRFIDRL